MTIRKNTKFYKATRGKGSKLESASLELIAEEPLQIRIDEKAYSIVMRTPGDEQFHAVGFCLCEGIIDSAEDIQTIGYDEHLDPNVVDIWLTEGRRKKIEDILKRKSFVSQTSCGICGKQFLEDLNQELVPVDEGLELEIVNIFACIDQLSMEQKHYRTTRGSHAALLLNDQFKVVSFAEDVGRHNALDKAIGQALLNRELDSAKILIMSSRSSHELVQKAARARIEMMISHSRPTTLAVEMAKTLNMTLMFPDGDELLALCGEGRIRTTLSNSNK